MKTITSIMNTEWKNRSLYVLEERAVPNIMDGFKPVQRYLYYLGTKSKGKMEKVASIAGNLASVGYHHGETSGAAALTNMATFYKNNLPIFEGEGNFGNRFDDKPSQPRYIFSKLASYTDKLFLDTELAPKHEDEEHIPPKYYLPIIPMCLVNGIKGIATGWAVDIPPHCPESVIDAMIAKCDGKSVQEIKPKYYLFSGDVSRSGNSYIMTGTYKLHSQTKLEITEIPETYDFESYEAVLDKLLEKGQIVDYINNSTNNIYNFSVTLKRGKVYSHDDIIKMFKLQVPHTWNVNTISEDGKLQEWDSSTAFVDIINYFYEKRLPFVTQRIANKIVALQKIIDYKTKWIIFCSDVISGKFNLKITDEEFEKQLKDVYKIDEEYVSKIMNTAIRYFTPTAIEKMKIEIAELEKELDYFKKTTPEKEYKINLNELKKAIKK